VGGVATAAASGAAPVVVAAAKMAVAAAAAASARWGRAGRPMAVIAQRGGGPRLREINGVGVGASGRPVGGDWTVKRVGGRVACGGLLGTGRKPAAHLL